MTEYYEMWDFLYEYRSEISSLLPKEVKCEICHLLLIDAQKGPCNCLYCNKCVEIFIKTEGNCCPGTGYNCRTQSLESYENVTRDHLVNYQISQLNIKCPLNLCEFRCEIILMSSHLKSYHDLGALCPFRKIRCPASKMKNDHLLSDLDQHSKLIIESVANVRNKLEENYKDKKEKWFSNEDFLKIENSFNSKLEEIVTKREKDKLFLEVTFQSLLFEIESIKQNMKELCKLIKEARIYDSNKTLQASPYEVRKPSNFIAVFEWQISEISTKKKVHEWIKSEKFYSVNQEYLMWMEINTDGCYKHMGTHLYIQFSSTTSNKSHPSVWPMDCLVSVTIINRTKPHMNRTICKCCTFSNPDRSGWEVIHFCQQDLILAGLIQQDSLFIKCNINNCLKP